MYKNIRENKPSTLHEMNTRDDKKSNKENIMHLKPQLNPYSLDVILNTTSLVIAYKKAWSSAGLLDIVLISTLIAFDLSSLQAKLVIQRSDIKKRQGK